MVTLYKVNNLGQISWWEIEEVTGPAKQYLDDSRTSVDTPQDLFASNPIPIGYNTWWGNDHRTQSRQTDNHQFTPASDKPTMSVHQQIQSQIDEMIARKGYSREIPSRPPEMPMLAQTWADFCVKANSDLSEVSHWPDFFLQPKIDGVRCIATPLSLYSRRNSEITSVPHIEATMNLLLQHPKYSSIKLDGELYFHGADLQTIQSAVLRKSYDPNMYRYITYQVFDVVDTTLPQHTRLSLLNEVVDELTALWQQTDMGRHKTSDCPIQSLQTSYHRANTGELATQDIIRKIHNELRDAGYEGVVLRKADALYQCDYRTFDLIKYKDFADAEFLIIDVIEAKDRMGTFVCQTLSGKTFKCAPSWTTERKRQILRYKDNYIGRRLTVKYERISKDGIPLKPIGVTIRDKAN